MWERKCLRGVKTAAAYCPCRNNAGTGDFRYSWVSQSCCQTATHKIAANTTTQNIWRSGFLRAIYYKLTLPKPRCKRSKRNR